MKNCEKFSLAKISKNLFLFKINFVLKLNKLNFNEKSIKIQFNAHCFKFLKHKYSNNNSNYSVKFAPDFLNIYMGKRRLSRLSWMHNYAIIPYY